MLQRCGACKVPKPLDQFSPSYRGTVGTWCRACFAAYARGERGTTSQHEPRTCTWCAASYVPRQLKAAASFCNRACKDKARLAAERSARSASKPADRVCRHCGVLLPQSMRRDAKFCSPVCNSAAHQLGRKLRARGGLPDGVTGVDRIAIAERDRWCCGICRTRVSKVKRHPDPRAASLDHIVPVAEGGGSEPSNLRLAHLVCNLRRRDRGGGEQLALVG